MFRTVYLRFLASSRQAPAAVMAITPAAAALLPVAGDVLEVLFLVVSLVLLFAVVFSAFFLGGRLCRIIRIDHYAADQVVGVVASAVRASLVASEFSSPS